MFDMVFCCEVLTGSEERVLNKAIAEDVKMRLKNIKANSNP